MKATTRSSRGTLLCTLLAFGAPALAQETIVSLPWTSGFSAGPLARDYPDAQNNLDIWVVEDFVTDRAWNLDSFSCVGAGGAAQTQDVTVVILDDWPTTGHEVLRSTPGSGRYADAFPWGRYTASFGGARLPSGSYKVMWNARVSATNPPPVMFVQHGSYAFGQGLPDNAYQYNPGGGWNLPQGVLDPVTDDFNNQGNPVGVNFTLTGTQASCDADFDHSGQVDFFDYLDFVQAFASDDPRADFDANGQIDFFDYLDFTAAFAAGC